MMGVGGESNKTAVEETTDSSKRADTSKRILFNYPMIKQTDMMEDMKAEVNKLI